MERTDSLILHLRALVWAVVYVALALLLPQDEARWLRALYAFVFVTMTWLALPRYRPTARVERP